ncbi:MAG: hydrogenase maturation protease [Chloroflexi bacterium]|nr:hydrogenase maturation protease [Chloroflexota bacterium]
MSRTLILGLGNPILTDDGVGIRVARLLQERLADRPGVTVDEASLGGLRLLEVIGGYDRLILVDAIQTANGQLGQAYRLDTGTFCATLHSGCTHDVDFFTALELGRRMGMHIPEQIEIIAIEAGDVLTFGETCTPAVEEAIPVAAEMVMETLTGA